MALIETLNVAAASRLRARWQGSFSYTVSEQLWDALGPLMLHTAPTQLKTFNIHRKFTETHIGTIAKHSVRWVRTQVGPAFGLTFHVLYEVSFDTVARQDISAPRPPVEVPPRAR